MPLLQRERERGAADARAHDGDARRAVARRRELAILRRHQTHASARLARQSLARRHVVTGALPRVRRPTRALLSLGQRHKHALARAAPAPHHARARAASRPRPPARPPRRETPPTRAAIAARRRTRAANRVRAAEPDARHVSARVSVAAERRCASAMSVRRARVTARGCRHVSSYARRMTGGGDSERFDDGGDCPWVRNSSDEEASRGRASRRVSYAIDPSTRRLRAVYARVIDPRTFVPPPPPLPS